MEKSKGKKKDTLTHIERLKAAMKKNEETVKPDKKVEITIEPEVVYEVVTENNNFDYTELDNKLQDDLKNKRDNIIEIGKKFYTDIGKELKEAQEILSSHNKEEGIFLKWCNSFGMKKSRVYRLINRYNFLLKNKEKKSLLEQLPVTLTYEVAEPKFNQNDTEEKFKNVVDKVLDGEITSLKEFKEAVSDIEGNKSKEKTEKEELVIDNKLKVSDITFKYENDTYHKTLENMELLELKVLEIAIKKMLKQKT